MTNQPQASRSRWLTLVLALGVALSARAQEQLLFTADTAGALAPYREVPGGPWVGGAARLATLLGAERGALKVPLLDAGNSLCGPDSDASKGGSAAAVLAALHYDAVNVGWRDFRYGRAATLQAVQGAKLPAISCTLADAASGELLLPPFTVVEDGAGKLAVVGATAIPTGLETLPYLAAQLDGIRVLDAAPAVRQALVQARSQADRAVLLFYGSADAARALQQQFGGEVEVVIAGGVPAAWLSPPAAGARNLVGSAPAGSVARLRFGAAEPVPVQAVLRPTADTAEDAAVMALVPKAAAPSALAPANAPRLAAGATVPLDCAIENRGVRIELHSAALTARYGARTAASGMQLLVLDASLWNIIPETWIKQTKVPTEYHIPKLGDHLYLVVDGCRLARLLFTAEDADAAAAAGHLPVRDLSLPRLGSTLRGNVVFEVPDGPVPSLQLRFYDFAHGHCSVWITGDEPARTAPLSPMQQNEVVELGVFGLERRERLGEQQAPEGMTFVVLDVRARSVFTVDADATAFDPQAKFGQRLQVGTVADWTDSRRYLQLVVDGVVGFAPCAALPDAALTEAPRFLPDLMTGGKVAFLAPAAANSLQLRCDFPNAKSSLDGKLLRPHGFAVALVGSPPALADAQPIASSKDSQFEVSVLRQWSAPEFDGVAAGDGSSFFACAVEVRNVGKDGEFFQPGKQLQLATADGKLHALDGAAARGAAPAQELLWVPAGERRRYTALYRLAQPAERLRLCYASVDAGGARMLALPPLDGAVPTPPVAAAEDRQEPPPQPAAQPTTSPPPAAPPQPPVSTKPVEQPVVQAPVAKPQQPGTPPLADILKPPHAPLGIAGVGLTAEQLNRAIDRGAAALWDFIRTEDLEKRHRSFGDDEEHLLSALALVHADAHKKIPAFDRELRRFLAGVEPTAWQMYRAGLLAMLVEAYGDPSFQDAQRQAVRSILETQGPEGTWDYSRKLEPELFANPDDGQALRVTGGVPLEGEAAGPMRRHSAWTAGSDGDNSVSQYAILGLLSAQRSGITIDPEVWQRNAAACRAALCTDGGWAYRGKSYISYGSMTCAGLCSLAISVHELGGDPKAEDAVLHGLAWLDKNFAVNKHPGKNSPTEWLFYYLYSLERVGRILDLDFIGGNEWYPQGARFLLGEQLSNGLWKGAWREEDPRIASSFALLFLTRATATLQPEVLARGGEGTLKTGVKLPPGGRFYFILDGSGSMLEKMDGVSKWQIARDAVEHLVDELPDNSEVALRVYGHRKNALEPGASDDTELVLPMRKLDKQQFAQKLQGLRARGKTPLARSLRESARDLNGSTAKTPVTLVLLTDGGEDSLPRQDPVAAAEVVGKLVLPPRSSVKLFVIGFDIGREDWIKQLDAMTAAGGGTYCPARQAEQLQISLRAAVLGVPESFAVRDADGALRARGAFGDALRLPEGRYTLDTNWAGRPASTTFWINTNRVTGVTFDAAPLQQVAPSAEPANQPAAPVEPPANQPAAPVEPPAATPRFCSSCGKPLVAGAKFCPGCGTKVKQP